jgi:hypothetical protein
MAKLFSRVFDTDDPILGRSFTPGVCSEHEPEPKPLTAADSKGPIELCQLRVGWREQVSSVCRPCLRNRHMMTPHAR